MLHSVVVAALLGSAALVAERVLRGMGRQGRRVWAAALSGSLLLPLAVWRGWMVWPGWLDWSVRGLIGGWELQSGVGGPGVAGGDILVGRASPGALDIAAGAWATLRDALQSGLGSWSTSPSAARLLLYGWLLATVAVAMVLLCSSWRLGRARSGWSPGAGPVADPDNVPDQLEAQRSTQKRNSTTSSLR